MAEKTYKVRLGDEVLETLPSDTDRIDYIVENPDIDPRSIAVIEVAKFITLNCVDHVLVVTFDEYEDPPVYQSHYCFNQGWADYLTDTAPDHERQHVLDEVNKKLGKFALNFNWLPTLTTMYKPDAETMTYFIDKEVRELNKTEAVPDYYREEEQ